MRREEVLEHINALADELNAIVIAGNGLQARFLHHTRDRKLNFYMLGSMGLAPSIALGMALSQERPVIVVEGDGNALMGMGGQAVIGHLQPKKFIHVVLNNGLYETTGGQPTVSQNVTFPDLARANGYNETCRIVNADQLRQAVLNAQGPAFLEIQLEIDKKVVPRVPYHPVEVKQRFLKALHTV